MILDETNHSGKRKNPYKPLYKAICKSFSGAANQIRTGDLVLTKDKKMLKKSHSNAVISTFVYDLSTLRKEGDES